MKFSAHLILSTNLKTHLDAHSDTLEHFLNILLVDPHIMSQTPISLHILELLCSIPGDEDNNFFRSSLRLVHIYFKVIVVLP